MLNKKESRDIVNWVLAEVKRHLYPMMTDGKLDFTKVTIGLISGFQLGAGVITDFHVNTSADIRGTKIRTATVSERGTVELAEDGESSAGLAVQSDDSRLSPSFLDLTDTPATYSGEAEMVVAVKLTEDGLEFVAQSGVSDHGDLDGLGDSAGHDWALLLDGSRALTGAWDMGNQALTNVNIDSGVITGITDLAVGDGGTGASNAGDARTNLGLVIGTNVQAYDAELAAIAGLTSADGKLIEFTGSGTAQVIAITAAGKALIDDANAGAQRTTLGLVIGTNVLAYDVGIQNLAGVSMAANKMYYTSGDNVHVATDLTAFGRTWLGYADAAAALAGLSGQAGAEFLFNTQKVGGVVDPTTDQQVATKKYVDDTVGAADAHAILDGSVHTDSVADGVTRGSIIYGNTTPKWDELVLGAVNTFLGSDGTDLSYRTAAQVLASLSGAAEAAFDCKSSLA